MDVNIRTGFYQKGWRGQIGPLIGAAAGFAVAVIVRNAAFSDAPEGAIWLGLLVVAGLQLGQYVQNKVLELRGAEELPLEAIARLRIEDLAARSVASVAIQYALIFTAVMASFEILLNGAAFDRDGLMMIAAGPLAGAPIGIAQSRRARKARALLRGVPEEITQRSPPVMKQLLISYSCVTAGVAAGILVGLLLDPAWRTGSLLCGAMAGVVAPQLLGQSFVYGTDARGAWVTIRLASRNGLFGFGIPFAIVFVGFEIVQFSQEVRFGALAQIAIAVLTIPMAMIGGVVFGLMMWLTMLAQNRSLPKDDSKRKE